MDFIDNKRTIKFVELQCGNNKNYTWLEKELKSCRTLTDAVYVMREYRIEGDVKVYVMNKGQILVKITIDEDDDGTLVFANAYFDATGLELIASL